VKQHNSTGVLKHFVILVMA